MTGSKASATGDNNNAASGGRKRRSPSNKKTKNENKENKKNSKSKSKNKNNEKVLNEIEVDKSTTGGSGGEISTAQESVGKGGGLESPSAASFVSEAITVSMNSFSEDTRTSKSVAMVSVTDVNNNDSDALNRNSNSSTPISTIGSFTATSSPPAGACDLVSVPNSDLAICVKDENNNLVAVGLVGSEAESNKKKSKSKPNMKFHQLFPSISLEEQVIETYSCAYVKSLNLYQGMMFVTNNYICFHSKILNHENILILKFTHINTIAKSMHALIFPTAIRIQTQNSTYSFTSFRSRSQTLTLLNRLLNASRGIQSSSSTGSQNNTSDAASDVHLGSTLDSSPEQKCDLIDQELRNKYRDGEKKMREMTEDRTSPDGDTTTNKSYTSIVGDEDGGDSLSGSYCSESNLIKKPVLSSSSGGQIKAQFLVRNHPDNRSFTYYNDHSTTTNPNLIYDFDYSNLSENMVRISLRHKKTLLQKVKLIMGILIPGFFDISRIDALLPICFTMCVLLLLNAFVLLNKVNKVDDLFSDLLDSTDFPFHFDTNTN